jgi:hypothetical protein
MIRPERPLFLSHPGVISAGLYFELKKTKTEEQLLDIIKKNTKKIHGILLNLDYDKITQSLVGRLMAENLIDIDQEFPDIYTCIPPTFRQYTKKFDDSLLLHIEDNYDYKVAQIQNINSSDDMFNYILNNPSDIHLCMVWSNWNCFTFELVFKLVRDRLLDINDKNKAYDTATENNLSFKNHCERLLQEMDAKDKNYKKLSDIVYFLVHFI